MIGALFLVPVAMAIPAPVSPGAETPSSIQRLDFRSSHTTSADPSQSSMPSSNSSGKDDDDSTKPPASNGDGGSSGGSQGAPSIDFEKWSLQLPIGSPGKPQTISGPQLSSYSDPKKEYYYIDSSTGAVVMKVPGSPDKTGCVTTTNSKHCRTEFREISPSHWEPSLDTNSLTAELMVVTASSSTCIGQIHIEDSVSSKPVAELYYSDKGELSMGVEQTREGGNEISTTVGNVPVGQKFSYTITYEKGQLGVSINGGPKKELSTYKLNSPPSYFKAGNYNQGDTASEIHFFSISVQH